MQDTLQIAGIAAQSAGLLVLFLHWRAKRGLGAVTLVLGWTLVALGAIPWLLSVSPERGLAIAMLAPMASGLLLLAPDGLSRLGNGAKPKKERGVDPATALEPETATQGRLSRNVARWIGSVIAAPALALAAAAAWQAFVPGAIADRAQIRHGPPRIKVGVAIRTRSEVRFTHHLAKRVHGATVTILAAQCAKVV